ncbi:hypothetical protein [Methanooceanicella nereidis]|nr:hypothetical protein [Methanocella sp. CWC-04]
MFEDIIKKYFTNEEGVFEFNEHIDKFALIYAGMILVTSIMLKALGVI